MEKWEFPDRVLPLGKGPGPSFSIVITVLGDTYPQQHIKI